MKKSVRYLTQGAVIAALYIVLTHLQNFIPGGGTWGPIQFRASEALCVLAFFTPAAIPGLAVGCALFNLTSGSALPLDFLIGAVASAGAAAVMWYTGKITVKGFPLLGMTMPAIFNGLLVGAELTLTAGIGGAFWFNATTVALGELAVLLTLGVALFYALRARRLHKKLFQ
jgi:uncharacterized membrane protein